MNIHCPNCSSENCQSFRAIHEANSISGTVTVRTQLGEKTAPPSSISLVSLLAGLFLLLFIVSLALLAYGWVNGAIDVGLWKPAALFGGATGILLIYQAKRDRTPENDQQDRWNRSWYCH